MFSFYRPNVASREEFVAQLNQLYQRNQGFARLIGTQVAPAWADGRLIAEVMPQHLPALEWWLAQFWTRNSGMTRPEALLRSKIGQAQLKGRRVSPAARNRKAAKLRKSLADLWSQQAEAPKAKTLVNKQDAFAKVTRWQEANENDLKRIREWRDDAINLPFRTEDPMDLRPGAPNIPTHELELFAEEHHEHVDTSSYRSDEEWAHGTPRRTSVTIGGKVIRYEDLPAAAPEIITEAVMNNDMGTLDFLESTLESLEERESRQTWGYVSLTDNAGTLTLRTRTWRNTTNRSTGKAVPFLPLEKRAVPEPKRVVAVPEGPQYHSSIADWEKAAKKDKGAAAAYAKFQTEQAEANARRQLLNADDEATALPADHEETPDSILALLTEDRDERLEATEDIPEWLNRQIAFYTHVVKKAMAKGEAAPATAETQKQAPAASILEGLQNALENTRNQLETELELTKGKARRGLTGQLAHIRLLAQQAS